MLNKNTYRGRWGNTALWGTPPTQISEKVFNLLKSLNAPRVHYIIRNQFGKWSRAHIVNIFENSVIFILRCLTVLFMAYLTATDNAKAPQSTKKCRLLRSSYIGESFRVFTRAVLTIKLRCRTNFLKISNLRVAPPFLAVLPHNNKVHGNVVALTDTGVKLQS